MLVYTLLTVGFTEQVFAREFHGEAAYKVLRTHVWHGSEGSTLHETESLSNALQTATRQFLGIALGVADWRQVSSALARNVLKGMIEFDTERQTSAFEAGYGHTNPVALRNYGTLPVPWILSYHLCINHLPR